MPAENLPVSIKTMVIKREGMTIYYPQVILMKDVGVQKKMNQMIFRRVQYLIKQQHIQQDAEEFVEVIGTFEIKTNERNLLSLSLSNYAYAPLHAHGLTLMKSLTFDSMTGRLYRLQDLFRPDSDYIGVLSRLVHQQIKERDIEVLNGFTTISPDQDFYLADKSLVLYFQLYEITAYYFGFPMFPISVYEIEDIIAEDGPLARMLTNN